MKPSLLLSLALLALVIVVHLWDAWAIAANRREDTVSSLIRGWATDEPIIAVLFGVLIGHIFWGK